MSEPEEENHTFTPKKELNNSNNTTPASMVVRDSLMDLDLDLDGCWPFDQIFNFSLSTPFPLSSTEQPCSPLWAFSDENDDKPAGNSTSPLAGAHRLPDYPHLLSCNPDYGTEGLPEHDNKRRVPSPILGFTPMDYLDGSCVIKERMTQALRYIKESTDQHVLAQVWAPVKNGGRFMLTTSGQPFVLDPNCSGLHQYRMVSLMYMFAVDGESDGVLGLPARVFRQKLPEWTPNVQYYSSKEFKRLSHALHYNVQGTLALPVFEPSGQSCVGVIELIMTSQKINYAPEVDKVCKALEAVNLKSSDILDFPSTQICNEGRQNALAEILEILTVVCETHKLPLAQTWVPCRHRSVLAYGGGLKKNCSSFDGSCMGQICMSTSDVAFYVVDAHMWGFREACAEHHLQKGQGVAGRAFASHNTCFCEDITQYSKTEYPLVHYARMFCLSSCFAICLRSTYTGNDEYILEFFLPPSIMGSRDQQSFLDSLLTTMKPHFQSLSVASGNEIEEDERKSNEIFKASNGEKLGSMLESSAITPSKFPHHDPLEHHLTVEMDSIKGVGKVGGVVEVQNCVPISEKSNDKIKKPMRKRGKAEKSISLEVLQQYFAGSLKDAAKSLGVCPTTMKRICRQHGISRWPSRKINKVNRSLSKLKRVIESVQGAEGAFTLTSLATSSLPVAVGSISWPAGSNECNQETSPSSKPSQLLLERNNFPEKLESEIETQGGRERPILGSYRSRTVSGSSTGTPTSHGSCQGSPVYEQHIEVRQLSPPAAFSIPDALVATQPQPQPQPHDTFGGMLLEDAGSSHDLANLCPAAEERFPEYSFTPRPHFSPRPEMKTVTIKATYKEDIIRFRLSLNSGIFKVMEEVAKRLKLEMGTFDVKYLDDDHEWVLIACDADLHECVDVSRSSGSNIIRLLVHDIMANLGSSCESSGE